MFTRNTFISEYMIILTHNNQKTKTNYLNLMVRTSLTIIVLNTKI